MRQYNKLSINDESSTIGSHSNILDVSDEVFLSLPVDSDLALPLVATVS